MCTGQDVCRLSHCRPARPWSRSPSAHAKRCLFLICWLIPASVERQSAHSSALTLIAVRRCLPDLLCPGLPSSLSSPLLSSRLLPLPEDLPVHAAGLHFRHIVSVSPPPVASGSHSPGFFGFSPHTWQGSVTANKPLPSHSVLVRVYVVTVHNCCDLRSDLQGTGGRRLCVTIEPALLLKGDIMVSSHTMGYEAQHGVSRWVTVIKRAFQLV